MTATITEFDTLVASMSALGIPRDRAEAAARLKLGIAGSAAARLKLGIAGSGADVADVDDDAIEDVHVAQGDQLMRALGFEVICFSQKKRAKVTPGIPDRRYMRRARIVERADGRYMTKSITLWMEWKAAWGRQSHAQKHFQALAEACGEAYVVGGYAQLVEWLVTHRLAVRAGDILEPVHES